MRDSSRDLFWLALIVLAFLAFGGLFAQYLASLDTEWGHVVFGYLLLHGEVRPFQDEMIGARLPLPYYVIGVSQLVAGRDLLVGRLFSLAMGAGTVILTFFLGRSLGGRRSAFVSALLLATHSVVVGFYSAASHYALSSLLITAGLASIAVGRPTWGPMLGMVCFVAVAFTRAQLAVMVPVVLAYLLVRSRTRMERATLILVALIPPVVFFAWSLDHLKVLAYVPIAKRFVTALGYRSLFEMGAESLIPQDEGLRGVVWFFKRHFFWVSTTALVAGGLLLVRRSALGANRLAVPPLAVFVATLALVTFGWQVVGFSSFYVKQLYFKPMAAYATGFAPLWAVTLGYGCSVLLSLQYAPRAVRLGIATWLLVVFALSPTLSRHAAMPLTLPPTTTIALLEEGARQIRSVVPAGQRVFLFGSPIRAYLAGVTPYIQQIVHDSTLVPSTDEYAVARSGLWGSREIEAWLGRDAQYAIIEPALLQSYTEVASYAPLMDRMRSLLDTNFRLANRIPSTPWSPSFVVYVRNPR